MASWLRRITPVYALRGNSEEWLSDIVAGILRTKLPAPTFPDRLKSLAVPQAKTVIWGLAITGVLLVLSAALNAIESRLGVADGDLPGGLQTLWQVQMAVAAFALPIALFAIERAPTPDIAATEAPGVLVRESGLFPILLFALLVGIRIGHDVIWFPSETVFVLDYLLFGVSVLLTILAFLQVLRLLFDPVLLQEKAKATVKSRMLASIDRSIEIRLANNNLLRRLRGLGVHYWPFGERPTDTSMLVLRATSDGRLVDVHLQRLERLIRELPHAEGGAKSISGPNAPPDDPQGEEAEKTVWLMKLYGEPVSEDSNGILRIDTAHYENLDTEALEEQLAQAIRIAP